MPIPKEVYNTIRDKASQVEDLVREMKTDIRQVGCPIELHSDLLDVSEGLHKAITKIEELKDGED